MPNDPQQFIEEMILAAKRRQDLSVWLKHPETADTANTILKLETIPRRNVILPDLAALQARVLDKIQAKASARASVWASIPNMLKTSFALLGSLMIVVSVTMGVAVAALQSVPGQPIYPLKKIVENIELRLTPKSKVAALQIQFADNRISELQTVIEQQEQGQLSEQEVQKIVSATVRDIQKNTAAAAKSTANQPQSAILSKFTDISNKLKIASIEASGEVKIEIEKAIQSTQDSKAEAIKSVQEAGLEIEGEPVVIDNSVTATGKLTAASETSLSIGTIKFLLTKETKFIGLTIKDLKVGLLVDIRGQIKDNKTYADTVELVVVPEEKQVEPVTNNNETPAVSGENTDNTEAPAPLEPQ